MIILNKIYSSQELAPELNMAYYTFRKNRAREEAHLHLFYDYDIIKQGNSINYIFREQFADFIPYREYQKVNKNALFKKNIMKTIEKDPRQTGSNIARIIIVDEEIQVLNLKLSTVTVYTRAALKDLVNQGVYIKEDYRWCYLNNATNCYVLMSDEQVKILRELFHQEDMQTTEIQENTMIERKEGNLTREEANNIIGDAKYTGFLKGLEVFSSRYGFRPIKVPVYVKSALT